MLAWFNPYRMIRNQGVITSAFRTAQIKPVLCMGWVEDKLLSPGFDYYPEKWRKELWRNLPKWRKISITGTPVPTVRSDFTFHFNLMVWFLKPRAEKLTYKNRICFFLRIIVACYRSTWQNQQMNQLSRKWSCSITPCECSRLSKTRTLDNSLNLLAFPDFHETRLVPYWSG